MSLSDLAALGSFISGVAVVVTLVFLLLQMRQNTQAVRAAASQAHAANFQQLLNPMIEDGNVARLFRIGMGGVETLTDDERTRFLLVCSGIFRFYEAARLQWRHGQLDDGHWCSVDNQLREIIGYSGIQTFWSMRSHWHSPEFRSWVETLPRTKHERGLYEVPAATGTPTA